MATLRTFKTPDGYTFYLQPDGKLTDTVNPEDADMVYDSLDEFLSQTDAKEV